MMPALALSLLLAADPPVGAPMPMDPPVDPLLEQPLPKLPPEQPESRLAPFAITAAAGALGAAAAICGWPARNNELGRACAITGGTLGGGVLGGLIGIGIGSLGYGPEDSLEKDFSRIITGIVGMLVGLGVGALGSIFASLPAGTPRGALAIAGGGLGFIGATFTFVYEWNN